MYKSNIYIIILCVLLNYYVVHKNNVFVIYYIGSSELKKKIKYWKYIVWL